MIISKEELISKYANVILIEDRQFIELPALVCMKCFGLLQINVMHEPDRIEIFNCKCDTP